MTDRYIVVRGMQVNPGAGSSTNVANYYVVDLTSNVLVADFGDNQVRATSVAAVLNAAEA